MSRSPASVLAVFTLGLGVLATMGGCGGAHDPAAISDGEEDLRSLVSPVGGEAQEVAPTVASTDGSVADADLEAEEVARPRAKRSPAPLEQAEPMAERKDRNAPEVDVPTTTQPPADVLAGRSGPPAKLSMKTTRAPGRPASSTRTSRGDDVASARTAAIVSPPSPPVRDELARANTEEYTDHGVNPFTLVSEDHLSTFSIDVDTASYAQARRKLEAGALPPEAAVRVEEFVNYFDYDSYVTPKNDPFAVNMEAMPDPFRPGHHILRVGVQGKELSGDERPPLHLTFLVDVSGSMSSRDKLPLAQKSLHMLVDSLQEDDTVALATYAGRVARILSPTSAAHKREIHDAIEGLSSSGSTAMSAGIDLAYTMASESFADGHENRVIIMSDGDANVGNTGFDSMLSQIKGHADKGVTLTTVGFGMGNYRDTLMEQLSNKGDGNNFYIDSPEMAQRVFVEEMGGAMITIARDVKLQVEFHPESVAAYRLIGYENRDVADKDFRNDRVDAGEVGSGHNVTALYDVILKEGYSSKLATVRMRYERPGADKGLTGEGASEQLWVFADKALQETPFQASRDTRIAYSAATFAEILRGSPEAAEIDLEALARFAEKSSRRGEKDDAELVRLIRLADSLGGGVGQVAAR